MIPSGLVDEFVGKYTPHLRTVSKGLEMTQIHTQLTQLYTNQRQSMPPTMIAAPADTIDFRFDFPKYWHSGTARRAHNRGR